MNTHTRKPDIDSALSWARSEAKSDIIYWKDRALNGNGLIQQIADFILKQAQGAEK
jgi:hypothetical protein